MALELDVECDHCKATMGESDDCYCGECWEKREARIKELETGIKDLSKALKELLEVCYQADGNEELPECVDGSFLDQAQQAIARAEGIT